MRESISTRITVSLFALVCLMALLAILTGVTFYKATKSVTQITE